MFIYIALIESEEDKDKFEELYKTYKQLMFYIANNILKDADLAEDAVHQAFLRIINHLGKIDEINCRKTKGFIVTIIEHVSIDIYRKRKRENALSINEIEYGLRDLTSEINSIEETNAIIQAIASLPVKYSTVLRLKYSHGYTNEEISRILSITEENVRQRIVRAKRKLSYMLNNVN